MRFTNLIALGALGAVTVVSGFQDINNRDLDAIDDVQLLAQDSSATNLPIEARGLAKGKITTSTTTAASATSTTSTTSTTKSAATTSAATTSAAKTSAASTSSAASSTSAASSISCSLKRSRILPRNLFEATKGSANDNDGCDWALQENEYKLGNKISADDSVCVVDVSGCSAVTISVSGKKVSTFHILAGSESDAETAAQLVKDNVGTATGAKVAAEDVEKFAAIEAGIQSVFPGLTVLLDGKYDKVTGNQRYKFAVNIDTGIMTRSEYTSTCSRQS